MWLKNNRLLVELGIGLSIICSCSIGNAEHSMAGKYRDIFDTGTFYVEYSDNNQNYIFAGKENARMANMAEQYNNDALDYYNGKKDYPNVMYLNGKYYQFSSRKLATVALASQINMPELDAYAGWNKIRARLCIPEEFSPLVKADSFRAAKAKERQPILAESGKVQQKNKELSFDKYITRYLSHTGIVLYEKHYFYFYDKERLDRIDSFVYKNGVELQIGSIKIKKITSDIPASTFAFAKGCKVYAVGVGDMSDLLDQRPLVESY